MAIKINTSFGERLTSGMLNEKIHNITGSNEKLFGFEVTLQTEKSISITPGKALVNGCAIEETSDTQTITIGEDLLSTDCIVHVVLNYVHETKRVFFECTKKITSTMANLATLSIKDGVITEVNNHASMKTLNSVVGEAAEIEAQKIRDMIPSGFIELGELDYNYMLNNENVVKLKTKSVAYVNGYRIEIPTNTIIDIGKAPEKDAREDLLFIEAWKDNNFNRDGKLKWRLRHVADVDFKKYPYGLNEEQSGGMQEDRIKISQDLLNYTLGSIRVKDYYAQFSRCSDPTHDTIYRRYKLNNNDAGLFVAGAYENFDSITNTLDGYVYAIPMFKLYRKPSCGKATPFEYQKINPKVDYAKFAELIKKERVERVESENITGNTICNLLYRYNGDSWDGSTGTVTKFGIAGAHDRTATAYCYNIKPNTKYTFICNVLANQASNESSFLVDSYGNNNIRSNHAQLNALKLGWIKVCVTTKDTINNNYPLFHTSLINEPNKKIVLENCMVLEGDWTNKEIPEYFVGLKSLGEDEGNLITVKTGILDESSYDPSTGNAKLNTVSGLNYISSDNLITPEIEAQVKRGQTKLSDVTKLGKIDNMLGDEVVEFNRIKGRSIQNFLGHVVECSSKSQYIDNYWVAKVDTKGVSHRGWFRFENIKTSTQYTLCYRIKTNTLQVTDADTVGKINIVNYNTSAEGNTGFVFINKNEVGFKKVLITTSSSKTHPRPYIETYTSIEGGTLEIGDFILLEGNHMDTNLQFFDGIKAVGESEDNKVIINRAGKNLFNGKLQQGYWYNGHFTKNDYAIANIDMIPVKNNTSYSFYIEGYSGIIYVAELNESLEEIRGYQIKSGEFIATAKGHYLKFCTEAVANKALPLNTRVQIEEGQKSTSFSPYTEYKQELTLKEPLRAISGGIRDTIEGNKVIRRIGTMLLNGSEDYGRVTMFDSDNATVFRLSPDTVESVTNSPIMCDRFNCYHVTDLLDYESADMSRNGDNPALYFRILKSKLSSVNDVGFKTWLSQNPTTVYYQLATPIEEIIEPNYDKESVKTYQLDAPLRSLPNGVKDEIRDGKLIRRCGETMLSDTLTWVYNEPWSPNNTAAFYCTTVTPDKAAGKLNLLTDRLPNILYGNENIQSLDVPSCWGEDNTHVIYIKIYKTDLTSLDSAGVRAWLSKNPVKIIYELKTPIEIPLDEVHANTANFTLHRQFEYSDNYLLELPNGVKDTVENGKVIRRVKKEVFNGSENWGMVSANSYKDYMQFNLSVNNVVASNGQHNIMCDKLPFSSIAHISTAEKEGIQAAGSNVLVIRLNKNRLTAQTQEGFKQWLSQNPLTVLYQISPVEEDLSGRNNRYCPRHRENTYCGSMYVGNGTNDVFVENGLGNDGVAVDTPFRSIENKAVVADCKYKKNVDGYEVLITESKSNNLFDKDSLLIDVGIDATTGTEYYKEGGCSSLFLKVAPNTKYTTNQAINLAEYDLDKKFIKYTYYAANASFTTNNNTHFIRVYRSYNENIATLQISTDIREFEAFIPNTRYFENTESNDVDDLRHQVSLTGFNYKQILDENFDKLLRGEL